MLTSSTMSDKVLTKLEDSRTRGRTRHLRLFTCYAMSDKFLAMLDEITLEAHQEGGGGAFCLPPSAMCHKVLTTLDKIMWEAWKGRREGEVGCLPLVRCLTKL